MIGLSYYTLFNIHALGQVKLLPPPSSTNTNYVVLSYYRRFADLVSDSDCLDAPREIEEALILHAQTTFLREQHPGSESYAETAAAARAAWDAFADIDSRHPDNRPRFRLMGPSRNSVLATAIYG